ncbi:hypothetical protein SERLADRAFT_412209 [Serpula lacrymans var. lacrymans S7.9]|uniref:Uncharacterized protein n=1 Tax=Serpula lacrymans var. lacrymans (strain S7.9) TaxID=578457 RepID=F8PEG2_SERL9|nr:uncharacterized protein SERLADRAFT_412209 [Serpula lacrymans var. lacrymans S7.9]EGO18494.1 hypothetical protein SERLADRAFT_412209 [Serpula lacrymans var. lacrymans S7.9]
MTIECTKALTGSQATFKKPQAPNMYNAIVHAKSLEVNADLPVGEKKRLQEIQSLAKVKQGPEGLCKDKQEEMRNLLLEHCEIKSSGVCFNNAAAAHDLMCTSDRIGRELDNLALRTGSYGCFFLTQGHINNLGAATWYGSDNSLNFWEDVIGRDPDEIAQLFEQWGCSRNQMCKGLQDWPSQGSGLNN